jgi:hypothetical protein
VDPAYSGQFAVSEGLGAYRDSIDPDIFEGVHFIPGKSARISFE